MRFGDEPVKKHKRDSLRVLGSVGEPINPEVWQWYHDVVGDKRCAVVDTWWQTETGGILITALPGATPCKPGSATFPLLRACGRCWSTTRASSSSKVQRRLRQPLPRRQLAGPGAHDPERPRALPVQTYFAMYPGLYFTGDGCRRDEDGYYWITGRVDDVINVAGHRLGTAESRKRTGRASRVLRRSRGGGATRTR